jgi:hypothetical protein
LAPAERKECQWNSLKVGRAPQRSTNMTVAMIVEYYCSQVTGSTGDGRFQEGSGSQ